MPTYDYECDACGHAFELFQSITEPVKRKCPACKKSKLRRLFGTGAAIVFKGSGFYQTDYRSESYKKAAEKDSKASDSSGDKAGGDKSGADKSSGDSSTSGKESAQSTRSGEAAKSNVSEKSSRTAAKGEKRPKPKK